MSELYPDIIDTESLSPTERRERYATALRWFFNGKPPGTKSELARRINRTVSTVSLALKGGFKLDDQYRVISRHIGIPFEIMISIGDSIFKGRDPGAPPPMPEALPPEPSAPSPFAVPSQPLSPEEITEQNAYIESLGTSGRRVRFLEAFRWYLSVRPLGFNRKLTKAMDRPDSFIAQMFAQKIKSEDQYRLVCRHIGISFPDMIRKGDAIIRGEDPGKPPPYPPVASTPAFTAAPPTIPAGSGQRGTLTEPVQTLPPASSSFRLITLAATCEVMWDADGKIHLLKPQSIESCPVAVHESWLSRFPRAVFHALPVNDDFLSPHVRKGDTVIADISDRDPSRVADGAIYLVSPGRDYPSVMPRFLRKTLNPGFLAVYGSDLDSFPPAVAPPGDVFILGRVLKVIRPLA